MPVSPIDYGRYGHQDMVRVFTEEFRHSLWLDIEATVAEVQAEIGLIPEDAAMEIKQVAKPEIVTLSRTKKIEAKTRHDVAALIEAIVEKCKGTGARWVHYGLTSNDIKDTALGLQIKAAFEVIVPQVDRLCRAIANSAEETSELVAVGRSHGQHGVPITYGIRFAVWLDEVRRHMTRLVHAKSNAVVGKIAGATGSHAAIGLRGIDLQNKVLSRLGLGTPIATTQIVQRDRHAEVVLTLANLAGSIDKIATNFRSLQRTELAETYEPYAKEKQIGSSAMPHKRNPIICEKICGLSRLVRGLVNPALESIVSWEERDISHSSTERFVIPQSFILVDYIVREMTRVIEDLTIDIDAVKRNLELSKSSILSEYVMTSLIRAGLDRPTAHKKMRNLSANAQKHGRNLIETAYADPELKTLLSDTKLDVEDYYNSIREVSREIVNNAIYAFRSK
ncbi:MAG: adenylosuccinate lyase [Candidatus Thorarchaeota archaeon]|jgi:adenylosuccinate lyase